MGVSLGGSGGSSMSRSSASSYVDPVQQQYLSQIYGRARDLSETKLPYYPDSSVVGFSAETEEGLRRQGELARAGTPGFAQARDYNARVLSGEFLRPETNPYLGATYDAAARGLVSNFKRSVLPGASLGAYGRGGSGREANRQGNAYDLILARGLGELGTSIYGGNYNRERGYMESAAARAPQFDDLAYRDSLRLREAGAAREELSGRMLEDLMARYYYPYESERGRLADYAGFIGQPNVLQRSKGKSSAWNAAGNFSYGGMS